MASRLTVIFYIVLCLEAGVCLTILPWWQPWGASGWGDNYFLVYAAQKIGSAGLQRAVASGWVRGAVTGVGLLNLAMAFWEILHFRETVARLEGSDAAPKKPDAVPVKVDAAPVMADATAANDLQDAARASDADDLFDNGRRDR